MNMIENDRIIKKTYITLNKIIKYYESLKTKIERKQTKILNRQDQNRQIII